MGNAGSNNMHRERHKSSELSTPNSPYREPTSGAKFDKKPPDVDRSVVNGGSDEEQPYYTKTVGSADISEYADTPGSKRKRASTISSVGGTSVDKMSGKGSTESNEGSDERGEEQLEGADESGSTQSDNNMNAALPTVLRWDGGGRNVMISGTFSKWKPIPMVRSHGNFVTIIDLPMGDHEYKFCVDGEWKHDPKLKSIETNEGARNNLVSVRQSDFEVFEALAKDSENVPNYAEKEYTQDVPQAKPWEKISGPPVLPPHLLQVILNKDTPLSCEPTLLPEPNHVMLNHLYALSIKDGVMVLSATHRYRKKYVTTLLYKPI